MSQQKNYGNQFWFEIYLTKDAYTKEDWQKFLLAIAQHIGFLQSFKFVVTIQNNTLRYYLGVNKDVGMLSSNLDALVLRPIDAGDLKIPSAATNERFVSFVNGGGLIDVREKYQVKRSKELEVAEFSIRAINIEKAHVGVNLYFKTLAGSYTKAKKSLLLYPSHLLAIDFTSNTKYLRVKQTKYLDIQKALHIMEPHENAALFEIDTFPYLPRNYFLNLGSYDFEKHSFIIGASGSGKSKFIGLFADRVHRLDASGRRCKLIVIDPHASLKDDLELLPQTKIVGFTSENDASQLFETTSADVSAATELSSTLFKSLLADQHNPKVERVLRFSLYVLMTAQIMSLATLKDLLVDIEYRIKILEHVNGYVPQNVIQFFQTDFNELRTQSYTEAILPIITLVDEIQLQPAMAGQNDNAMSVGQLVNDNFLTVFSLNKVTMGEKVVKTVSGLLIQQIFLLAQARAFQEKVILIIDEVSVVQNPALAAILSEARKYNLFVFLTQQYFGQIEKNIQDAIFANVSNYYVFRVSEEDARSLEGNITIEVPKEILIEEKEKGVREDGIRIKMLSDLNPRECFIRLSSDGQLLPCVKGKTVDFNLHHGQPNSNTNHQLKSYTGETQLPSKFIDAELPDYAPVSMHRQAQTDYSSETADIFNSAWAEINKQIQTAPSKPRLKSRPAIATDQEVSGVPSIQQLSQVDTVPIATGSSPPPSQGKTPSLAEVLSQASPTNDQRK